MGTTDCLLDGHIWLCLLIRPDKDSWDQMAFVVWYGKYKLLLLGSSTFNNLSLNTFINAEMYPVKLFTLIWFFNNKLWMDYIYLQGWVFCFNMGYIKFFIHHYSN
jgi:hypothetical protein